MSPPAESTRRERTRDALREAALRRFVADGYTVASAFLGYNFNDHIKLSANVENLFDAAYFSDAHNNNNITPGAPINARLTARVKF